jgi:hypothetical protein
MLIFFKRSNAPRIMPDGVDSSSNRICDMRLSKQYKCENIGCKRQKQRGDKTVEVYPQ